MARFFTPARAAGVGRAAVMDVVKWMEDSGTAVDWRNEMALDRKNVEEVLEQIRPSLQRDGGDVELVDVTEDGVVKVRLKGHCACCPHAQMTLSYGIEAALKEKLPEVSRVEAV